MKLNRQFQELQNQMLRLEKLGQREIKKNYKKVLDELRLTMAKLYELYEEEGILAMQDMTKYNRLQKLDQEVNTLISNLYKGNSKVVKGTLEGIAQETYSNSIAIVKGQKQLKGIPLEFDVKKVINEDMAGLKWTERMGKHRADAIWEVQSEIKQGLSKGDTYSTMAKRLKDTLETDINKANTIIRTEGHRVLGAAKEESFSEIEKAGVLFNEIWLSSKDERVRSSHQSMDGQTIKRGELFVSPSGAEGPGPGLMGSAADDINCRCIKILELVEEVKEVKEEVTVEEVKEEVLTQKVIEGEDLQGNYIYDPLESKFDHDIEDVLHQQGFDGLPRIVDEDTFRDSAKKSNFYAERSYSADSPELLAEYQNQLYEGKFYVDASTGGAQYGQGMYVSSVYDIADEELLQGITKEMLHYRKLGEERGFGHAITEAITIDPSARVFTIPKGQDANMYINNKYQIEFYKKFAEGNEVKKVKQLEKSFNDWIALKDNPKATPAQYRRARNKFDDIEFSLDESMLKKKMDSYNQSFIDKEGNRAFKNIGTKVAEMGYDVIRAEGHGESGSYSVILNRTKLIIQQGGVNY